ncbi:MAG: FeoB-associated Cys-rich membrane protein [Ruminococcus sp.]|nr:FeoB-associated Cys-rich membrane protein [Ruminococcus sp.]
MKKFSIIALIIGTAAATGYFVTKMIQKKKSNDELFDDYDDCCDCDCDGCGTSESDLDVDIPDSDAEANDEEIIESDEKTEE